MAEQGAGRLATVAGGLGVGALMLVRVCGGAGGDVVRVGAHLGDDAVRVADDVAGGARALTQSADAGSAAAHASDAAHVADDGGPVGQAVDAALRTADVVEILDLIGGPEDQGLWLGEVSDRVALERTLGANPGRTVGFVVRSAGADGALSPDAAREVCDSLVVACWIYSLDPGIPVTVAEAAWQAAEESPVQPAAGTLTVAGAPS
jgi:hypothetical protein